MSATPQPDAEYHTTLAMAFEETAAGLEMVSARE